MVTLLDNLAMAAVQKNETIEKQIEMNNQKDKIISSLTDSLKEEKATNNKLLALMGKSLRNTQGSTSKRDPKGYCWTHGYRVTKDHTSKTCQSRHDGHKEEATRYNTMGGNKLNNKWKPNT